MPQNDLHKAIVKELYGTLVLLGAQHDLLGAIGSWGTELSDNEVLEGLRAWNAEQSGEIKQRIEHYETSCPHPAHSHAGDR